MGARLLQFGVLAVVLTGFVTLAALDKPIEVYTSLVAPILTAVIVTAHTTDRSNKQDQVLQEIHHNTNGVLEERIKRAVQAAQSEREP